MTMAGRISKGQIQLAGPVDLPDGTEVRVDLTPVADPFHANLSADELARRQHVQTITSPDDLAGDWPSEDSLDEFLALVREVRR